MPVLNLKPTHKIVTNYYKAVAESGQLDLLHEGAVAPHFAALLRSCAAQPVFNGFGLPDANSNPRQENMRLPCCLFPFR